MNMWFVDSVTYELQKLWFSANATVDVRVFFFTIEFKFGKKQISEPISSILADYRVAL